MRKLWLGVAGLLVAASVVPAFAQETLPEFIKHTPCEVDMTGETIPLYHFGDLSGPFAFITQPFLAGFADAIAYFNARGGACGATFVSNEGEHYRDTGGNQAQTQAHYDYFSNLEEKPKSLVLYASADAELLRTSLAEDEIPVVISAGSVEGLYGQDGRTPGWIYATNPLYGDQLGSFCEFVAADPMNMYPDEPVIGYISWPGAFGQAAFTPEVINYCAEQGVTILPTPEIFLPTDTDISGQVLNLVDEGANILYTNTLASGPALVAKTLVDLGLQGTVKLAGVNWALDTSVGLLGSATLGSNGLPAVTGLVGSLPFRWYTEVQHPGIALIREQFAANNRQPQQQNIAYLLGWATIDMYIEIYTQTANRVGSYDAITGADIKETLDNIKYGPLGGIFEADFKGGEMRALSQNRMAIMQFLNKAGNGPATSGEDAATITAPNGATLFVPLVVPITEFAPAPDLRPGG
ncbi:MAG: ABC transporter substrate-binding protein [Anaerolineae bacterium]|nr:ABC transporter substrate-binding protein [Anaerolineae bacterium]MDW8171680.1 ABC transporter substrate-binding protein [Anaerolineae bacterium]